MTIEYLVRLRRMGVLVELTRGSLSEAVSVTEAYLRGEDRGEEYDTAEIVRQIGEAEMPQMRIEK